MSTKPASLFAAAVTLIAATGTAAVAGPLDPRPGGKSVV